MDQATEALRPFLRDPNLAPIAVAQIVAITDTHIGSLPTPRMFADYDSVVRGSAREILDMAKAEQRHRHQVERLERQYPFFGLAAGATALVACVVGAVYLGMHDKTPVAVALLGAPVIAAVGWFVNGRAISKRDHASRKVRSG